MFAPNALDAICCPSVPSAAVMSLVVVVFPFVPVTRTIRRPRASRASRSGCSRRPKAAWKEAHSRLYDHLRGTTREGTEPKLADLAPLYHAIAHGCRAGRHQEALDEVYVGRISRRLPDGRFEAYSVHKLGAASSDLAAISWSLRPAL